MKQSTVKTERKHVVMVVPTLSTGGAEKFVRDVALHMDRDTFALSVVVLFPKTDSQKERDLEQAGIPVYHLDKKPGIDWKCMRALKKLMRQLRPDVIHSHLDVMLYLLPCYKRSQVKLHTVHSMASFEAAGLQKRIRKFAFKHRGVTPVAIGETVKESIASYYGLASEKIPCIYNGVPKPSSLPQETRAETVFVNVGTLYYVKNHEMLLRAFKRCTENSEHPVCLHLVGDGELRESVENQVKELGLEQHVKMIGWTDNVYAETARADVYVCSSIMEGISLSIIEAMFCGLPIVATDVGGNKDLVKHGENGLLFENRNEDALYEAMMTMINDRELRARFSENSKRLSEQYTIEACVKAYEALYNA